MSERRKKLGRVVQTKTEECVDHTAGKRSADYLRFLVEAEMRAVDPDEYLDMDDSDADDFEIMPGQKRCCLDLCWGASRGQSDVFVSKEIPPPVSRIPTQPDIEMGTAPLLVPEDAMEVDKDAGVQRESVRCGRNVLIRPTWKCVQTLLVSAATVTQLKH